MKKLMLIISLLSVLTITNAQIDENFILSAEDVQKNKLKVTPELEEMVVTKIKDKSIEYYAARFGIKNKELLENLQLGKPIPLYQIVNEKLYPVIAMTVHRLAEGESLSLRFSDRWLVPVMSADEPLFFAGIEGRRGYTYMGPASIDSKIRIPIEHIHNYEHKDLIIGSFEVTPLGCGIDFLIIRKEDKDIFVEVYDEVTGDYFKNEYGSGELIKLLKDRAAKEKEARSRYYDFVADKSELEMTPEITKMVVNVAYGFRSSFEKERSDRGIKDRAQFENIYPGKPIPLYMIENEKLTFIGRWEVPVMSNGEPLFFERVKFEDDGQYEWAGSGGTAMAEGIRNYEYKDLIIGFLGVRNYWDYLMIRRENRDIFVQISASTTGEYFKNEYSLSEIINLLKK